jgi:hypothetical protein
MVYCVAPHCHKDNVVSGLTSSPVPSGNYTKPTSSDLRREIQILVMLNVNLNNFIIEHTCTTETKIRLIVPLDHNIFSRLIGSIGKPRKIGPML